MAAHPMQLQSNFSTALASASGLLVGAYRDCTLPLRSTRNFAAANLEMADAAHDPRIEAAHEGAILHVCESGLNPDLQARARYAAANSSNERQPHMSDPLFVFAALCAAAALAEWLGNRGIGRRIGGILIVIALGAVLANTGVIPSSSNAPPLYGQVLALAAPISIFMLLMDVNLVSLKQAGAKMLGAFLIGSAATMTGVLCAFWVTDARTWLGDFAGPISGMYVATHWTAARGARIPAILILTTLALLIAQLPALRLGGANMLGTYGAYLFLAVIGAYCDLGELAKLGELGALLMLFVTIALSLHGLIVFAAGA